MQPKQTPALLDEKAVAERLGVSRVTVRSWRHSHREQPLAYIRLSAGTVRYLEDDVAAFIAARRVAPGERGEQ